MERKVESKRESARRPILKSPPAAVEPFGALAEPAPVRKAVEPKSAARTKAIETEIKPVKKSVRVSAKAVGTDPFAETAESVTSRSMPVKAESKPAKTVAKRPAAKNAKLSTSSGRPIQPATQPAIEPVTKPAARPSTDPAASVIDPPADAPARTPAFKLLAEPTLPDLPRQNRARLQMQTPTRLYFYWSVKENPWATLRKVFGSDLGSYTLVVKLIDKSNGREDIRPTDADGNFWFDVEPNRSYQAEIGFYAVNRPYFRVLYSNTVETPRRSPSPRAATESEWRVTAAKFAEVLDVAGFSRDAVDVAMAGDDHAASTGDTHRAFAAMLGTAEYPYETVTAEDIRYAMLALASGVTLEELRSKVSAALFAILHANAGSIEPAKAMNALTQYFDIDDTEFTEEQHGPAVFGASLVNFPRTLRTKTLSPKYGQSYSPVSSHSLR
ncbi:MAG: DUF4912 domain-containing protein [Acidobacteriota bacterium]